MRQLLVAVTTASLALTAIVGGQPAQGFLRKQTGAIRVFTWNVYHSSILPAEGEAVDVSAANRPAQFARVLKALQPDVVCLQDVTATAARSAALVSNILPLPDGRVWQAHAAVDTVIVSRFDITARAEGYVEDAERRRGHSIALINTPATDMLVVCAHFQSSDGPEDVALRRRQALRIASTLREAKAGRGQIPLRPRTPFIVLGDFNAIAGSALFVEAMVSGKVADSAGRREALDWDGSPLTDARPQHNASGSERYTWRDDLDQYPPGILDRILYSDSVLASVNQFVLDTTAMSYAELVGAGLRTIDVMRDPQAGIHDHLPVVIDLVVRQERQRR